MIIMIKAMSGEHVCAEIKTMYVAPGSKQYTLRREAGEQMCCAAALS